MASIPIRRHVQIRGDTNPYDPRGAAYLAKRHVALGDLRYSFGAAS